MSSAAKRIANEILSWRENNSLSMLLWQADRLRDIAEGRVNRIPDVPGELNEAADSIEALYEVMTILPDAERTCEFVFDNNSWSTCDKCGFTQIPSNSGYRYCPNCGRHRIGPIGRQPNQGGR